MSRTQFLVERNKRRKEIRDKVRFVIAIVIMLLAGIIPLGVKLESIRADNADTWIDDEYVEYIEQVCSEKYLCPELVEALIESESSGQADVVSSGGCVGLMQLNPKYFEGDLLDWKTNIDLGTDYLIELFEEYGDLEVVLTAYNCGEYSKITKSAIETGEGNSYAKKISKRSAELERIHGK